MGDRRTLNDDAGKTFVASPCKNPHILNLNVTENSKSTISNQKLYFFNRILIFSGKIITQLTINDSPAHGQNDFTLAQDHFMLTPLQ